MKKIAVLILAIAFMQAYILPQNTIIKIKGSDTVLPVSKKIAEIFMNANPGITVTVTGGGSSVGLASLIMGTTDIAMSSRSLNENEKNKLLEAGKTYKEVKIGFDALSVIVHPQNAINQLTREQLEDIFTGKTNNWKEVGGQDLPIIVYSRESSSGTYEFLKEHVLNNKEYGKQIIMMPATDAILQSVSQTKGAIGYEGFAYVNNQVKALKVSFDKGKNYINPSLATIKDRSYPIVRPLYYYYLSDSEEKIKIFIDFILSDQGQKIIEETGYASLN